jgi:DNA helicase-2/ATP-dependent DNA helicase PcrA
LRLSDEFILKNIFGVNYLRGFGIGSSDGTSFGNEVHKALERILLDKAKPEDFTDKVQRAVENGLDVLDELREEFPGLQVVRTEVDVDVPMKSIVKYEHDDLVLTGKIDVLFKHDSGYLMVDWKTSMNENKSAVFKRQLSVYKKLYSIEQKIPEDKITTCVIFVALRGNVETGVFGRSKHIGGNFKTFEKHLLKILEWKKDPKKLIKEFLDLQENNPLVRIVQDKLTNELRHRKTKPKKPKSKKS